MTATEDRMREAFDRNEAWPLVKIAASVADEMVAEATADLRKQHTEMLAALKAAIKIASEAADEWDKAAGPPAPRAGKILLALCGHMHGYRQDIDAIHAAVAAAEGTKP